MIIRDNSASLEKVTFLIHPPALSWSPRNRSKILFPDSLYVSQEKRRHCTINFSLCTAQGAHSWLTSQFLKYLQLCLLSQSCSECSMRSGASCNWSCIWNWQLWTSRKTMWQGLPCLKEIQRKIYWAGCNSWLLRRQRTPIFIFWVP